MMESVATAGIVIIQSIFLVIHLAVLFKWIPYSMVWGGRLKTDQEMYRFEAVSIVLTLVFLGVTLEKMVFDPSILSAFVRNITFWIMTGLFGLNTIGNLLSKNKIERLFFTPLALMLTIFSLIIALNG